MIQGEGGDFLVTENPNADGSKPSQEVARYSEVGANESRIKQVSLEQHVDPDLIRAIMYVETTHGHYDAPLERVGINGSIRPMNVNVDFWAAPLGLSRSALDATTNIRAGARILKGIAGNMPSNGSVAAIATLYNDIGARTISDYGARVSVVYAQKPWRKR